MQSPPKTSQQSSAPVTTKSSRESTRCFRESSFRFVSMLKKQRDFLRLRHAKEYIDGVRKNPFFFKAPPKQWIMIGAGALMMAALIAGTIGLTYLPMFRLTSISVSGTTIINPEEIQKSIEYTIANHGYPLIARDNIYLI